MLVAMATAAFRFVAVLLVAFALVGCKDGPRNLVVRVENASPWPATLMVGELAPVRGGPVGTAFPDVVAPGATADVTFGVPAGRNWAIFVNPGPRQEPLVTATDVPPDAAGEMPFSLGVAEDGALVVMRELDVPGWFGH